MAVPTTQLAIAYDGNGSAVTPYPIPFPFLDTAHIYVAYRATEFATPLLLTAGSYTVTRFADGSGGSLVTTIAITDPEKITIFRNVPLLQPLVLQTAGPFPAKSVERECDRLLMQVQQLQRAINELNGVEDGNDYLIVPAGGLDLTADVLNWADATERGSVNPSRQGQLGVQIDDNSLWVSGSGTVGDWDPLPVAPDVLKWADETARATTAPTQGIGQLGVQIDDNSLWLSSGSLAGNWVSAVNPLVIDGTQVLFVPPAPFYQALFLGTGGQFLSHSTGAEGAFNTGLGSDALRDLTTGSFNLGAGYNGLAQLTSGIENVGLGWSAGSKLTSGSRNTAVGAVAGWLSGGSATNADSVFLGNRAKPSADGNTNEIVVGYDADGGGSNTVVLGNDSIVTTRLKGSVGIGGNPNANALLDVASTTKAFLPPRMTTAQKNAIASPTGGMVVYDSSLGKLCVYGASAWETITSA